MRRERLRVAAACCSGLLVAGCTLPWSRSSAHHASRGHPRPSPTVAAQFTIDGRPVSGAVDLTARSHLRVVFATPAPPGRVAVALDGRAVPADSLAWSTDLLSVEVPVTSIVPYQQVQLTVSVPSPYVAPGPLLATMRVTVAANGSTGVQPGFRPQTPVEIVVENSGPARPQSGLQDADLVYEYLSEYSITRMTAIYFAHIPAMVGPVRSCRMINPYIGYAYGGVTMCSGVSDGTGGQISGTSPGSRSVPTVMQDSEHFFRVGFRAIPHNLYTSGDLAERVRGQKPQPAGDYAVDPPHPDEAAGQPADAPSAGLHGVTYAYDGGSGQYLRFDGGTPSSDQVTHQQLRVKNVVLMHVPFHDAGWVEDANGGAHSVWYDMLGSGPAEVFSDGRVVHATWHMGAAGQGYFDNHLPVWFTDEAGRVLLLNTGLTWIHALGNGQDRCPVSPSGCG